MTLLDTVRQGNFLVHPEVTAIYPDLNNGNKVPLIAEISQAVPVNIDDVSSWIDSDWKSSDNSSRWWNHDKMDDLQALYQDIEPSFALTWWEWKCGPHPGKELPPSVRRALYTIETEGGWQCLLFDLCKGFPIPLLSHVFMLYGTQEENRGIGYTLGANESESETIGLITVVSVPVLMAQTLMHCETTKVQVEYRPMPPKLAKKHFRKHGYRPSGFRYVVINAMKAEVKRRGGVAGIGGTTALWIPSAPAETSCVTRRN